MVDGRASVCVAVLAAAGVLSACGGGSSGGGNRGGGNPSMPKASGHVGSPQQHGLQPQALSVRETEMKITPADPTIKRAGPVEFKVKNAGKIPHALAIQTPAGTKQTATIQPGQSTVLKVDFTEPGHYRWFCPVDAHASKGMTGTVTVK